MNLGSACGTFVLGESGWQQSAPGGAGAAADADATKKLLAENAMLKLKIEGAGGADADGENKKLLAENNMLKLKIEILVEMLARQNLDIDAGEKSRQ